MKAGLKKHGPGIFTFDHNHGLRILGMNLKLPLRTTAIQLAGGDLWVHSPVDPDSSPLDELRSIGPVKHIVAPNTMHHLWAPMWKERFPEATLYACPNLPQKRKDAKWDVVLEEQDGKETNKPKEWDADIDYLLMHGLALSELVFLHKPSKTLILTDMAFNWTQEMLADQPWIVRKYLELARGNRECCVSTPFKWLVKDKAAVKASLDRVMKWDFDRVLLAHGVIIPENGKEKFAKGSYAFFQSL